MYEYYKLAADYFQEFEPRNAFPGLGSFHWYLLAVSLAFFAYFGHDYFFGDGPSSEKSIWPMFLSEIVFLVACVLISLKRFRLIVRATSEDSGLRPIERLALAKRARLEALLGRPAWQFMATAQEIIALRGLEKASRPASDRGFADFWTKIYDPDSKARLLTLLTALLGLMTAVLGKDGASHIMEALGDGGAWAWIKALAQLVVLLFIVSIAAYPVLGKLLELLKFLFSALFPVLHDRPMALDYLIRDLIQYHRMEPMAPGAATPEVPMPLPAREPGLGSLAIAVCLAMLRRPPVSGGDGPLHK